MGIITTGLFSILVCSIKRNNKLVKAVMDYHLWYGKNSLWIMATHVPVKGVLVLLLAKALGESVFFVTNDWWCLAILFILTCAICSVLSLLIVNMKKKDEQRVERWQLAKTASK